MDIRRILIEELNKQSKNCIDDIIKENLHESLRRYILNESQESSSQKKAKKLAMKNGMDEDRAERFVRIELRNDLSELRHSDTAKFTLGCARLFFDRQLTDADNISLLNEILGLITKKYYNDFDQNLNGLSIDELSERFSDELDDIEAQNRNEVDSEEYEKADYEINAIDSFKEASAYEKYCYDNNPWCITYREDMWDTYTNNGYYQVYFCLKNGYENMEAPEETGNPKDEYGLSMISVIVDEKGKLKYSTTRWNHANNANGDHDLTVQEISKIVGVNFYDTFKPNGGISELLGRALKRFKNGEDPNEIFDDVYEMDNGFLCVKCYDKYNYINKDNEYISDTWFDDANEFEEGFAKVELEGKYNLVSENGNLISEQWFDDVIDFSEGFANVQLNGKWNVIDMNGNYVSNKYLNSLYKKGESFYDIFDMTSDFQEGFATVMLDSKCNFIDEDGMLFSDVWFDNTSPFVEGIANVQLNGKWNFIDRNGRYISDTWFDEASEFIEGFAIVNLKRRWNDKWNFIDRKGKYLSDTWFDKAYNFKNGIAKVMLNNKWYSIDKNYF